MPKKTQLPAPVKPTAFAATPEKAVKKVGRPRKAPVEVEPKAKSDAVFSAADLLLLELGQLRVGSLQQSIELRKMVLEKFATDAQEQVNKFQKEAQAKIEEAKKELHGLAAAYQERANELTTLYTRLESAYEVKMDSISYDSKTGKVTRL